MKMNAELYGIPTPAVVAELDTVEKNIVKMKKEAEKYGISHRPHIKTHRSGFFAGMQIDAGCKGITAAKLGEAEAMADCGIDDIFIAYPLIGEDKLDRLLALSERVKVSTIINSQKGAEQLSKKFSDAGKKIEVLIEVDGGLNRGGIKAGKPVLEFAKQIRDYQGLEIKGLMYYGGLIYNSHNKEEIREYAQKERDDLVNTSKLLTKEGFSMEVLSAGSSFSGKVPEDLKGITEIRSGHYIFNDCGQLDVGLAEPEDCALNVITTVVAKPDDHVVICDAGTKTFSSDKCHYREGFGYVTDYPEIQIYNLNEEHAFLRTEGKNPLQIGDKICVIPNHACVVTNLAEKVYGFRNGRLEREIAVEARGKSV